MKPQVKIILLVTLLAAAAAGAWLANITLRPEPPVPLQSGTRLMPPRELPEFGLVSHEGKPLRREDLTGRWSLVFFGFTHCPDVCPTTLAMLSDVRRRVMHLPQAEQPRVVFVSVDPERDTPQVVSEYIRAFDPSILGITGEPTALDAFATSMGIAHRKIPINDDIYMVDHTAVVLMLDPKARQAAVFSPPYDAAAIAADYCRMLGRMSGCLTAPAG